MSAPRALTEAQALAWAQRTWGLNWGWTWKDYHNPPLCCVGFAPRTSSGEVDSNKRTLRGYGLTWAEAVRMAMGSKAK